MSEPFFVEIENRGLVQIEGEDRHEFLQNLVSNDISAAVDGAAVYACLLSPQGKFLHDFFILEGNGVLLLDCEGGERAQNLYKRLNIYRLRAKVSISVEENSPVFAGFGDAPNGAFHDPRHPSMGWRAFEKPQDREEKPFKEWDHKRVSLTVPDGSRDIEPERDTLLEFHIDRLNGISFEKGCYVGQEVTARMKHRGLVKKHLYTVHTGGYELASRFEIHTNGHHIGEMRSSCGDLGLAMLKDELVEELSDSSMRPYIGLDKNAD